MSLTVTIDHISYTIPRLNDEVDYSRLWFVAKQFPYDDYSLCQAIKLARYWHNRNKYECTYSAPIEKRLKEAEGNRFK